MVFAYRFGSPPGTERSNQAVNNFNNQSDPTPIDFIRHLIFTEIFRRPRLRRKWRLTCCGVSRQTASNEGKNRLQGWRLILTSESLPPSSPPAVAQLFFIRSMRLHHPK